MSLVGRNGGDPSERPCLRLAVCTVPLAVVAACALKEVNLDVTLNILSRSPGLQVSHSFPWPDWFSQVSCADNLGEGFAGRRGVSVVDEGTARPLGPSWKCGEAVWT